MPLGQPSGASIPVSAAAPFIEPSDCDGAVAAPSSERSSSDAVDEPFIAGSLAFVGGGVAQPATTRIQQARV